MTLLDWQYVSYCGEALAVYLVPVAIVGFLFGVCGGIALMKAIDRA